MDKKEIIEFYRLTYNIKDLNTLNLLSDNSHIKFIKKQTDFIKANEVNREIYILKKGMACYCYPKNESRDIIDRFFYKPGDVILDSEELDLRKKMRNIRAIKDCEFIVLSLNSLQKVMNENPHITSFIVSILKQEIIEYQNLCFMRSLPPEKRILYFLEKHKDLSPILTNIQIAKFLDMNRQEFSKKLKQCKTQYKKTVL